MLVYYSIKFINYQYHILSYQLYKFLNVPVFAPSMLVP